MEGHPHHTHLCSVVERERLSGFAFVALPIRGDTSMLANPRVSLILAQISFRTFAIVDRKFREIFAIFFSRPRSLDRHTEKATRKRTRMDGYYSEVTEMYTDELADPIYFAGTLPRNAGRPLPEDTQLVGTPRERWESGLSNEDSRSGTSTRGWSERA